jgi:type I restriction enzyme S subunit
MERYEKYKESGVKWIGEIPEGWEITKLVSTIEKLTNGRS